MGNRMAEKLDIPAVRWYKMNYEQIEKNGLLPSVVAHVNTLDESQRECYLLYLKTMCGFPAIFMAGAQ